MLRTFATSTVDSWEETYQKRSKNNLVLLQYLAIVLVEESTGKVNKRRGKRVRCDGNVASLLLDEAVPHNTDSRYTEHGDRRIVFALNVVSSASKDRSCTVCRRWLLEMAWGCPASLLWVR